MTLLLVTLVERTFYKVSQGFYWPGIFKDGRKLNVHWISIITLCFTIKNNNVCPFIYGVVAAKRNLVHIIKIFQIGTSKLMRALKKNVCVIKNSDHCNSMMDRLISSA